jgi:exopolysaccharide biosynthesis polyprenyl glycosylphosphotransferase
MRNRDSFDVACSTAAVAADAVAVYVGFLLAVWIRFDSGWIPLLHETAPPRELYHAAGLVMTLLMLFIFQSLHLYSRPQLGSFSERIPRLVRAIGLGILLSTALAFVIRTEPPLSRLTVFLSFGTTSLLVMIERLILFKAEIRLARRRSASNRVLILGVDTLAANLKRALEREPRLRTRVVGFLRTNGEPMDPGIDPALVIGDTETLPRCIEDQVMDQVILASSVQLPEECMARMVLDCERAMIAFHFVPDLFRILTISMDIQSIDGIPVLGNRQWPLDYFWNRIWKRTEDIVGSLLGIIISIPILITAAILIRRQSPGPVFFRQERCGEKGQVFTIYKLRTMVCEAESETGPVWASEDDPRRTPIGATLRAFNLDELPQFWNVLKGDMSLVGPRPERPHFVEQFKEDISRYMWRHAYKPGMTGWAQVNGLRGNTSIKDRIKFDLYYLENWSVAFDFKILALTFFTRKNAY